MKFSLQERFDDSSQLGERLFRQAVRSGVWLFALRIIEQGFNLIRLVILARILVPHDFGLFGIALLAMMTLETFSQTGFERALIQKKESIHEYLDAAWTVSVLRGLALCIILFFAAPYVATFFTTPTATPIIRVIGITAFLQGLTNIGVVYFQKELKFNRQFFYQLSGTLADFFVVISAALILKSVWALVFGMLASAITRLIVSYLIHPYRPGLSPDLGKTRKLFGFGKWILGSSILLFLITQGDDILVGKLLGVTLLGFYQMAYRISSLPATEITHVISQVTFPAYSKIQSDLHRLRGAYLKALQVTALVTFPLAGGIFILAPEFTTIFMGEKWMPMVSSMQVLTSYGLIRSIGATTGPIFQAIGKPGIATKLQFVHFILLTHFIYPLTTREGILGTSLAVFFAALIANLLACFMVIKVTQCRMWNFCKMTIPPLVSAGIMILIIFVLKKHFVRLDTIPEFLACIVIGILIYVSMAYLFDRFFGNGAQPTIREILSTI